MTFLSKKTNNFYSTIYNFGYAALLAAALLSIQINAFSDLTTMSRQTFIFFLSIFAIFHAWWRTGTLLTRSAKVRLTLFNRLVFLRFIILAFSVLILGALNAGSPDFIVTFSFFAAFLTGQLFVGVLPFFIVISPAYGKERVMIRRELLAEIFYMAAFLALTLGTMFNPALFATAWIYAGFGLLIFLCRPTARFFTKWKELEPPHRGGRTRRHETSASRRVQTTSARSGRIISTRPDNRRRPMHESGAESRPREQRPRRQPERRPARPQAPANRRISARDSGGSHRNKPVSSSPDPENGRTKQEQNVRSRKPAEPKTPAKTSADTEKKRMDSHREAKPQRRPRVEKTPTQKVEKKTAAPKEPDNSVVAAAPSEEAKSPKPAQYGRRKRNQPRGKRPRAKSGTSNNQAEKPEIGAVTPEEQPPVKFVHQEIDRNKDSISYGRKRKASSKPDLRAKPKSTHVNNGDVTTSQEKGSEKEKSERLPEKENAD